MRLSVLIFAFFLCLVLTFPASASVYNEFGALPGEVDLPEMAVKIAIAGILGFNTENIDNKDYAKHNVLMGAGKILIDIFCKEEGRWLITRSALGGVKNPGAALLASTVLNKSAFAKPKTEANDVVNSMMTTAGTPILPSTAAESSIIENITAIGAALALMSGDFEPIVNNMQNLGFIILGLTFIIAIVSHTAKPILGQGNIMRWHEGIYIIGQALALYILIKYVPNIIWTCVQASESIRKSLASDESVLQESLMAFMNIKGVLSGLKPDQSIFDTLRSGSGTFLSNMLGTSSYMFINVTLYAVEILADFGFAITAVLGPIVLALVMLPSVSGFGGFLGQWIRALIGYTLIGPLIVLYKQLGVVMFASTLDTGTPMFLVLTVVYIMGAATIPQMAMSLSGSAVSNSATGVSHMASGTMMSGGVGGMMPGFMGNMGGASRMGQSISSEPQRDVTAVSTVANAPQATTGSAYRENV